MINSVINRSKKAVIWATRPSQQNVRWCERLQEAGWATIEQPLLSIQKLTDASGCAAIKNVILDLDYYDSLIFVSQNAVEFGFEWIDAYWPELPVKQNYLAVGSKTAKKLSEYVSDVAAPNEAMDSDALLALPECADVADKHFAIFRGRGGLPRLGQVLEQRGAVVHYCELYDRVYPGFDPAQADTWRGYFVAGLVVVPIFSGETLQNLQRFFCELSACSSAEYDLQFFYSKTVLVVPGKRVASMAIAGGFERVFEASNASEDTMLAAVNALSLSEVNPTLIKGEMHD